jgi:hypothetical protein
MKRPWWPGAGLDDRHWILAITAFRFSDCSHSVLADIVSLPPAFPAKRTPLSKPNLNRASTIVLNWEGRHLLEEFLPSVVEASNTMDAIMRFWLLTMAAAMAASSS